MNQEMLLKLVLPSFTYELLAVVKVLITSPIHEAGVIGLNFRLWAVFFLLIGWWKGTYWFLLLSVVKKEL